MAALILIAVLLSAADLWAQVGTHAERVVSVLDGDTIEVLHNQYPEPSASALVYGKQVSIQPHGLDKYGRTLADVLLPDGTNVNHTLVKEGWCWWYRKYAPGDTVLEGLEKEAREGWKGLWADPVLISP